MEAEKHFVAMIVELYCSIERVKEVGLISYAGRLVGLGRSAQQPHVCSGQLA